jgi:hypothetical protein
MAARRLRETPVRTVVEAADGLSEVRIASRRVESFQKYGPERGHDPARRPAGFELSVCVGYLDFPFTAA